LQRRDEGSFAQRREAIVNTRVAIVLFAATAGLLYPHRAAAQDSSTLAQQSNVPASVRQAENTVESEVRRLGVGVQGGVGLDPEIIDFGAHATFSRIFIPSISFRPGVEFGVGELTTLFGVNLDVLYTFAGGAGQAGWVPYLGAGPNFTLSHRGFNTEGVDENTGNRFDFSDTDFSGGFNFIAGARNRRGVFFEMKATAYGVSNVRLLAGFNF
jgi:hypothetical protein